MNVLVTGATGAVGPHVVQSLCDAGYHVRTLSLDTPQFERMPDGVDVRFGDVTDASTVKSAMQSIDIVIHLAALLHIVNPLPELREKYERINVRGTAIVVDAAVQAGIKRLVFFSTIAVYGSSQGKILTEDSPPNPDTFYAQNKLAAERIVLDARRADGQNLGTVLRLAAVYGSRVKGNYRRLLQALARKRFIPIGSGTNRRTLIYDKDVANAALAVLTNPNAAGKVFNVTDGEIYSLGDIIKTICDALGRRPPRMYLPVAPLRTGAEIVDKGTRMLGLRPFGFRSALDKYTEDLAVDGQKIEDETGFRPEYDLLSGWRETIEEMRARGEL